VGPRLLGWVIAAGFCIPAAMFIWPPPWRDDLRRRLSATVAAVGKLVAARAQGGSDPEVTASVASELSRLRAQFRTAPYPPVSAAAGAVALATLVGRVEWLAGYPAISSDEPGGPGPSPVGGLMGQVAEALQLSARLICDGGGYPVDDPKAVKAVQESTGRLQELIGAELDAEVSTLIGPEHSGPNLGGYPLTSTSLDQAYRDRGLAIAWWQMPHSRPRERSQWVIRLGAWLDDGHGASFGNSSGPICPSARSGSATPFVAQLPWPSRSPWLS